MRIAADEEMLGRLASTVAERDVEGFATLVRELQVEPLRHLLCHWVCTIRCRRVCRLVCGPDFPQPRRLVEELVVAAQPLRRLLADERLPETAATAVRSGDCEALRGIIHETGLVDSCELICEWFCTWRCLWLCLDLCGRFPVEQIDTSLTEAFEFARTISRLSEVPDALDRLARAVSDRDAAAYATVIDELQLERFCIQLCHWICVRWCRLFCICVCPPVSNAYFIRIGVLDYLTDVASALGGSGTTVADNRAFYGTMRLNGSITDLMGGPQIEYCFEARPTDAAGNSNVSWSQIAPAQIAPTLVGWFIQGPPPWVRYVVNGTPGPLEVPATINAGWIQVPPLISNKGQFVPSGDLALLISNLLQPFPQHDETGVVAGGPAAHPLAEDVHYGIRMRVREVGSPPTEHDGGTCVHVAIDNTLYENITRHPEWDGGLQPPGQLAVAMVDIQELHANGCADLSSSLTVLFTAAHPNLDPAGVSVTLTGPGGPYAFALPSNPDPPGDWYGTAAQSGWTLSQLQDCAYIVTLSVNVLLTNGDPGSEPSPIHDQIAFCKTSV